MLNYYYYWCHRYTVQLLLSEVSRREHGIIDAVYKQLSDKSILLLSFAASKSGIVTFLGVLPCTHLNQGTILELRVNACFHLHCARDREAPEFQAF